MPDVQALVGKWVMGRVAVENDGVAEGEEERGRIMDAKS